MTHFTQGHRFGRHNPERTLALVAFALFLPLLAWALATRPEGQEAMTFSASSLSAPACDDLQQRAGVDAVGTCRTRTATLTAVRSGQLLELPGLSVRNRDARFLLAATASGKRRMRARLSVWVALRNTGDRPLAVDHSALTMSAGGRSTPADAADRKSDRLLLDRPIAPGTERFGVLRFETAGETTSALIASGRADVGVRLTPQRVGVIRLRPAVVRPASRP